MTGPDGWGPAADDYFRMRRDKELLDLRIKVKEQAQEIARKEAALTEQAERISDAFSSGAREGWMRCGTYHIDLSFEGRPEEQAAIDQRWPLRAAAALLGEADDELRQCLQVIRSEADNIRCRIAGLLPGPDGIDYQVASSQAAIDRAVDRADKCLRSEAFRRHVAGASVVAPAPAKTEKEREG